MCGSDLLAIHSATIVVYALNNTSDKWLPTGGTNRSFSLDCWYSEMFCYVLCASRLRSIVRFSMRSSIIQLLDKYISWGSNGSLQGQMQIENCNAKNLPSASPTTTVSHHSLFLFLSPPAPLMAFLYSPCFHSYPLIPLALFGHQ